MQIKKITDCLFKIPKEGKMHVPLHIVASERIFEHMQQDLCMQQGMNMATLPGIYKHSVMMPDAHQGYGFPVGGVAAYDANHGCISPGGIGFDINCLSADTTILNEHGYFRKIKDYEMRQDYEFLVTMNSQKKELESSHIIRFIKIKPRNRLFHIQTKTGRWILATEDHPFMTPSGMIPVKNLSSGTIIAAYPFLGIPHEEPDNNIIISEKNIDQITLPGNAKYIKDELKKRGLLPLRRNHPLLPYLVKLFAVNLGDGTMYSAGERCHMQFYGNKEDLEIMKRDIKKIGYQSFIFTRKRIHKIQRGDKYFEFDHLEHSLHVSARSLIWLLHGLGTPAGKKTHQNFVIPQWLMEGPKWHKRLFLAALFGAEMTAIQTMTNLNHTFYMPTFSLSKIRSYAESGEKFIKQIEKMLNLFDIRSVFDGGKKDFIGKDGNLRIRFKLFVYGDNQNLIRFFETINFEYHLKKRMLANAAANYLRLKEQVIADRKRISEEAFALYHVSESPKTVFEYFVSQGVNRNFLEKCIWRPKSIETRRIPQDFPTFQEYLRVSTAQLGHSGMVWDVIEFIKEDFSYDDYVYDFTVDHKAHNFIANGFIVSNCSVSLLSSNLDKKDIEPRIHSLLERIFARVPCGVGETGAVKLSHEEFDRVLNEGIEWALKKGYATKDDRECTEEYGCMEAADSSKISQKAKERGKNQLGTLGAGNHFLEIQVVDEIFSPEIAEVFGITHQGQICVMIHCGSRGLGHQTCKDYLHIAETHFPKNTRDLVDRELAYLPANSKEAKDYFAAMSAACNFAYVNHRVIAWNVRKAFCETFDDRAALRLVYHISHNTAKLESFRINGRETQVYVHRKGATRALPPQHPNNPRRYMSTGHPILIPGSMGTASYVLAGTEKAVSETFASTPHGAGRLMSRHQANKQFHGAKIKSELEHQKIYIRAASWRGISEEAPGAYKDIDEVAKVCEQAGIGKIIVRLRPFGVIKG